MESFLASRRKQLNFSQRQIADFLGYAPQLVSLWEKGKTYPDLAVWSRYAGILRLTLEAFLSERDDGELHVNDAPSFDAEKFSANLKRLRERRGCTQGEVARFLGVNIKTVSNWERGVSFPNRERFLQLTGFFHCAIDELYFALEPRPVIMPEVTKPNKTRRNLLAFSTLLAAISAVAIGSVFAARASSNDSGTQGQGEGLSSAQIPVVDPGRQSQEPLESIQQPKERQIVAIRLIESDQDVDTYEIAYDDGSSVRFTLNRYTGRIASSSPLPELGYENGVFLVDGEPTEYRVETTFADLSKPINVVFINNVENLILFGIVYARKSAVVDFFQVLYEGGENYHIYSEHDVYLTQEGSCVVDGYDTGVVIDFKAYYPENVTLASVESINYLHSEGYLDYYDLVMETGFEVFFTYDAPRKAVSVGNALFRGKISLLDSKGFWNLNGEQTGFRVHSSKGPYEDNIFTVRWLDYDGVLIMEDQWTEGCIPVYAGASGLGHLDGGVTYNFSYWSPEISSIHEDTFYTANYAGNLTNRSYRVVYDEERELNLINGFSLEGFTEETLYLPINCDGVLVDGITSLPEDFPSDIEVHIPATYSYVSESVRETLAKE